MAGSSSTPKVRKKVDVETNSLKRARDGSAFARWSAYVEFKQRLEAELALSSDSTSFMSRILKGPEIRTGFLEDEKPIQLKEGQEITVTTDYTVKGDVEMISMSYKKLPMDVKPGNTILCAFVL